MSTKNKPTVLNWRDLQQLTYATLSPFTMETKNGDLIVERILRFMPRKRLVAIAKWQGQSCIAKLFINGPGAKKHFERDLKGVKILKEHCVPTPAVIDHTSCIDDKVHLLLFEKLTISEDFEVLLYARDDIKLKLFLKAIVHELATQHVMGLVQKDLHFNNFLISNGIIYTIDGAEVTANYTLLEKKDSMQNLALLLSQLGVGAKSLQKELFLYYASLRGWLLKKNDWRELKSMIQIHDGNRWEQYRTKLFRECTDFAIVKGSNFQGMAVRGALSLNLQAHLENPELFFSKAHDILKDGRSATVIKVRLDDETYVVKRYNMKDFFHHIRRSFRTTRARHVWYFAHKLQFFRVRTPAPVAYMEFKKFGIHGTSYYISRHVSGVPLLHEMSQTNAKIFLAKKVAMLLKNLLLLSVNHGDLKERNILIKDQEPYLIDLDGMQEHKRKQQLVKSWRKDVKRFLANFKHDEGLEKLFKELIRVKKKKEQPQCNPSVTENLSKSNVTSTVNGSMP